MTGLVGAVLTRPTLDLGRAAAILASHWGISGDLRQLPSERDRNVAVAVDGVDAYVLKISNATDDRALLEFQHEGLLRLREGGLPCPEPLASAGGEAIVEVARPGEPPLFARVMRWVPGRPLSTVLPAERSPALIRGLGVLAGRTAEALLGWDHPAAHRPFQWNPLAGRGVIDAHAEAVVDPAR